MASVMGGALARFTGAGKEGGQAADVDAGRPVVFCEFPDIYLFLSEIWSEIRKSRCDLPFRG
jgi:hypothetical protein